MKTRHVVPGMVMVAALANAACGNHVCPPWGCYPAPSSSTSPATHVAQGGNTVMEGAGGSAGLLSGIVTFFKDIVTGIVPGGRTAGAATAEVAPQLGRPTEAVKKKASRMGLRKSKKYMKSLGRT